MKRVFIIVLSIVASLAEAAIPDGAWNGKPWDKKVLNGKVKANEADALAEWAFCSARSVSEVGFNKQLIFRRSKAAAEKGSALGKYLYAACAFEGWGAEIKEEEGKARLEIAFEAGHPEAIRAMGGYQQTGLYDIPKNMEAGVTSIKKAAGAGSLDARHQVAELFRTGEAGEIDLEEAVKTYQELINDHGHLRSARVVFRFRSFESKSFREIRKHFSDEDFERAEKIVKNAARLGQGYDEYLLAYRDLKQGKLHEALPTLIENSRKGGWSHRTLLYVMDNYQDKRNAGSDIVALTMGGTAEAKAAEEAYRLGFSRDNKTARIYATALIQRSHKYNPERVAKGHKILREVLLRNGPSECNASHRLANSLCRHYFWHVRSGKKITEKIRADFDRGMYHLMLHSTCNYSLYWLSNLHERKNEICEPAKALAAAWRLEEKEWGKNKALAKKRVERLKKELTPEQVEEARSLRHQKFPHGDQWRRKAFLALQKLGDIAPDQSFDPGEKYPEAQGGF